MEPFEFVGHWDLGETAILSETIAAYEGASVPNGFNRWRLVKYEFPSGRGNYTARRTTWIDGTLITDTASELAAKIVAYYASWRIKRR